jgi:signal transduction histidine kinase
MTFSFWVNTINTTGFFIVGMYVCAKATNYSPALIHKAATVLWCLFCAVVYTLMLPWMPEMMVRIIFCLAFILFIWGLTKIKSDTVFSAYLLSYGISYALIYISIFVVFLVFVPFLGVGFEADSLIDSNEPVYLLMSLLIAFLQFLFAFLLFRIRRFKKGFPFLFERFAIIVALIAAGVTLVLVSRLTAPRESYERFNITFLLVAGILTVGAGIYIWIRRGIKKYQRKRAKERNEEILLQEIAKLELEVRQSNEINEILRAANHSINHRLTVMTRATESVLESGKRYKCQAEFSEELAIALADIRKLSDEYSAEVSRVKTDNMPPSTNIKMLDEMFGLFSERFANNNISFKLKVNGSIIYMIENVIEQGKLETLVGDLLQNAFVAVNAAGSVSRSVLALIGEAGDYYEFSVHDSGILFETETLARLGKERVTTHECGSGVGFMRTFETMGTSGASLIIRENKTGGAFTKSVTVRFDGAGEFIIT